MNTNKSNMLRMNAPSHMISLIEYSNSSQYMLENRTKSFRDIRVNNCFVIYKRSSVI